jgi:hypothetical protein
MPVKFLVFIIIATVILSYLLFSSPRTEKVHELNCIISRVSFNSDMTRYTFYLRDGKILTFRESCLVREVIPAPAAIHIRYAYLDDSTLVLLSTGLGFKFGETIR